MGSNQFDVPDSYGIGTVSVTNGSTTVSGTGTVFTGSMVGRQIKVALTTPVATIVSVESTTSLTVDISWAGPSQTNVSYIILQAYVTPEDDFLSFISVVSVQNMWKLVVNNHDSSDIDNMDPRRTMNGYPWIVASFKYTSPTQPGISSVPMFELWPHVTTAGAYPYKYLKRCTEFTESYVIPSVVTGDVIFRGAMADLCGWPGTKDDPNPMFSLDSRARYEMEWNYKIGQCGRQDNEIYQKDLWYHDYQLYPMSTDYTQRHGVYEFPVNI
jgi:hypothetical protein